MSRIDRYRELRCRSCHHRELCDRQSMVRWLRRANKLRPGREPEEEILLELFHAAAGQFACPRCGERSMSEGIALEEAQQWPGDRVCTACGRTIHPERLALLPEATLCAACQQALDEGRSAGEVEYCARCGSPMKLRLSRRPGVARYEMVCTAVPPCRQ